VQALNEDTRELLARRLEVAGGWASFTGDPYQDQWETVTYDMLTKLLLVRDAMPTFAVGKVDLRPRGNTRQPPRQ
jgi:hypothetical protein